MIDAQEADRLALQARRGDTAALAALYRAFAPPVRAYLRRLLGDDAAADDVLHETFLQLLEGRGRYRAQGRFRPWLFAVAANAARDHRRRLGSRERLAGHLSAHEQPPAPAPDEALARGEILRLVESLLDDLPPDYAAAFHLRVREGFSYREIAAMTGDPEGTLRSRVHHTLQRLREGLAAAEIVPETGRHEPWAGSEES